MKEKSCRVVVYRIINDNVEFLLVYQSIGHYSFPKGHMENGETELETAIREIKEETNLYVEVDSNFRKQITYSIKERNSIKDVVYFVATPKTFDLKPQEGEILNSSWYNYEETIDKLKYEQLKEILQSAYNYIKNKNI